MADRRFSSRNIIKNDSPNFEDNFRSRAVDYINQYSTGRFKYPTVQEMGELNIITDSWKLGDRLYKYAYEYYGNTNYWWIIAWFNKKPTENHFKIGDEVLIPQPLEKIFKYFED